MKRLLLAGTMVAAGAAPEAGAETIFLENFENQPTGNVNHNSENPYWRSSHHNIVVEGNEAEGPRLRTSWDTSWQLIGAQFSDTPLDITADGLHLTLDYQLDRRDTSRILFGLQSGSAWDPELQPVTSENGHIDNFTHENANPDTHYTADWSGYQAVLRVDGAGESGSSGTHVARNGGPMGGEGSVWFHNNEVLDTGDSMVPDLGVWRSAQLSMYLNEAGDVVVELYEGADRDSLQLLASAVDDDPDAILGGLQHIAIGVTGSGVVDGTHSNPIVRFDNISVVPEPASAAMVGLASLLMLRRNRGSAQA